MDALQFYRLSEPLTELHVMMIHDVKDNPILQVPSQELSTSSKYEHWKHFLGKRKFN